MKRIIAILFLLALMPLSAGAQGNFREEFEKFRNQASATYSDFRGRCNREYADFLRQAWARYQAGPAIEKPKEKEVPPVVIEKDKEPLPIEDKELPFDEVIPLPEEKPQPKPVEPVRPAPVIREKTVEFVFFNTPMKVQAPEGTVFRLNSVKEDSIADAWNTISANGSDAILAECLKLRADHKLCDWAYLLMLKSFSEAFLNSRNESVLLTAWLYCQSGYKMRLGTNGGELYLLYGSRHQIYGAPYFDIDGDFFYQLDGNLQELNIANISFPKEQGLSLTLGELPVLARDESKARTLTSRRQDAISGCSVNKNLLVFFENYPSSQIDNNPMTRWAMYANTPLDPKVKEQLYPPLQKAIAGKTAAQATNILLGFVQTAFTYGYDDNVWGHDRAFFAEETLYYPFCDCEDRSILFSRLVRDLLGLDVILVYYPGHLATAVKLGEEASGDYISLNSGRFLVCDPTYIGAPAGKTMPKMDNKAAKVILLKK
ncbi:MAG: hypothetical protein IJU69_00560 [Bacteroidales bacterium]|nr:hypothetical protein [Bacteroidales bacterium]